MNSQKPNFELMMLMSVTRRLPRIRGAGAIGTRLAYFYARKKRPLVTSDVCGVRMRLDPHDLVDSGLLFMPRLYDYREIDFLKKNLAKGDSFIDIGANIGFYSLIASSFVGNQGKVVSIEAAPATFDILKQNIEMNGIENISPVNLGVSSQRETLEMTIEAREGLHRNSGGNSFLIDADGPTIAIACRPLHEILEEHGITGRYAMKLDIQWFEYRVLKTFMENVVEPLPFCVILEQTPDDTEGDSVRLLETHGYRLLFKTRRHNNVMLLG